MIWATLGMKTSMTSPNRLLPVVVKSGKRWVKNGHVTLCRKKHVAAAARLEQPGKGKLSAKAWRPHTLSQVRALAQLAWGQRTLSWAKLFQNHPQFPFSNRFASFHGGAYVATTFVSWAAIVIYCHMHGLKQINWKHGDKFGDCWSN